MLDDVPERPIIVPPRTRAFKARVRQQLGHAHGRNALVPLIGHHHDGDELIAVAAEYSSRPAVGMERARAFWRKRRPAQGGLGHVHLVHVEISVDERALDVLAFAGALAMQQRKPDRHRRRHSGCAVADGGRELRRAAIGFADARRDAGVSSGHVIKPGLLTQRTGLTRERDRAHDQCRM